MALFLEIVGGTALAIIALVVIAAATLPIWWRDG